jgi:hypothetical protein
MIGDPIYIYIYDCLKKWPVLQIDFVDILYDFLKICTQILIISVLNSILFSQFNPSYTTRINFVNVPLYVIILSLSRPSS